MARLVEHGWAIKIWPGKYQYFVVTERGRIQPAIYRTKADAVYRITRERSQGFLLDQGAKPKVVPVEVREITRKKRKAVRRAKK